MSNNDNSTAEKWEITTNKELQKSGRGPENYITKALLILIFVPKNDNGCLKHCKKDEQCSTEQLTENVKRKKLC